MFSNLMKDNHYLIWLSLLFVLHIIFHRIILVNLYFISLILLVQGSLDNKQSMSTALMGRPKKTIVGQPWPHVLQLLYDDRVLFSYNSNFTQVAHLSAVAESRVRIPAPCKYCKADSAAQQDQQQQLQYGCPASTAVATAAPPATEGAKNRKRS